MKLMLAENERLDGEQRRIVAYLDSVQAQLASLRQLQSAERREKHSPVTRDCRQTGKDYNN